MKKKKIDTIMINYLVSDVNVKIREYTEAHCVGFTLNDKVIFRKEVHYAIIEELFVNRLGLIMRRVDPHIDFAIVLAVDTFDIKGIADEISSRVLSNVNWISETDVVLEVLVGSNHANIIFYREVEYEPSSSS